MRHPHSGRLAPLVLIATVYGCGATGSKPPALAPEMVAVRTDTAIVLDGRLDDAVWSRAPRNVLEVDGGRRAEGQATAEPARVQFAWDDAYLYVGAECVDRDVIAELDEDQVHHYKFGDVLELFLRPADVDYYWEMYVTPRGRRTTFFFPSPGHLALPSCFENYVGGLRVAAVVDGTLNEWRDSDRGWTAEMAVPRADLTAHGHALDPGVDWRVLLGRYNYGVRNGRRGPELTVAPELPSTDFHRTADYAPLRLAP